MVTGVNWMPFQLAKNTPFCGDQGHIAHVSAFQKLRTELQWLSGEDHFQRPFKRYGRPSWEPRYHQNLLKMGVWGKIAAVVIRERWAPLDARNWLIWWLRPSVHIHWSYGRVSWYCSLFFECMVWNCCQRLTLIHNHSFFSLALSFTTTW